MKKLSGYSVLLSVIFLTGCLATVSPTIANKFNEITNTSTSNTAPSTAGATRQNTTTAIVENKSSPPTPQTQFVFGELGELLQNFEDYLTSNHYTGLTRELYGKSGDCKFWGTCSPDEFLKKRVEAEIFGAVKKNDNARPFPRKLTQKTTFQGHKLGYSFATKTLSIVPTFENLAQAKLAATGGVSSSLFPHPIKSASCFRRNIPNSNAPLKLRSRADSFSSPFVVDIEGSTDLGDSGRYPSRIAGLKIEPNEVEPLFARNGVATFEGEAEYELLEQPKFYASNGCTGYGALLVKYKVVKYTVVAGGKTYVMGSSTPNASPAPAPVTKPASAPVNAPVKTQPKKGICAMNLGEYQKQQCVDMSMENFRCVLAAAGRYQKQCP